MSRDRTRAEKQKDLLVASSLIRQTLRYRVTDESQTQLAYYETQRDLLERHWEDMDEEEQARARKTLEFLNHQLRKQEL